jgi:transcriptional regulator with XRE-family HTH domain
MSFGETVRRLRKERRWTQQELGAKAGFPPGTISHIENGRNDNPTQETLDKLARALGISVGQLLGEDDLLAGPPPAPTWRAWGVPEDRIAQYSAVWGDLSRAQRVTLMGHLDVSARSLAAVEALIQQVEVRVETLRAQVDEADRADPARDPVPPEQTMQVQSRQQAAIMF